MSALADFHFLRPAWLLALLLLAYLAWRSRRAGAAASAWRTVFDPELLAALRVADAPAARWPRRVGYLAAVLAVLALAGPAWQRIPQPLLETREARVVVLDLSRSMDAPDLKPSRIARARYATQRFLEDLPGGRVGLVVFAGSAFTVVPLTGDRALALNLLPVLAPEVMPAQGGRIGEGLREALQLLEGGRALLGDVVVITDSAPDEAAFAAAGDVARARHRLWVIGVGTAAGAPVFVRDGEWLKDEAGRIVSPQLDEPSLARLATAGRGRYARLTGDDLPIDTAEWTPRQAESAAARFDTDVWRDEGRWLVLLLAPLTALAFRRGSAIAACLALLVVSPVFAADSVIPPWLRSPDTVGMELLQSGDAAAAAATFHDPRWRGVAAYRAGIYAAAAEAFGARDTADDHYNRGNALARAGHLREAVDAYEEALALEPTMADARHNRDLVRQLMPPRSEQPTPAGGAALVSAGGAEGAGPGDKSPERAGGNRTSRQRESDGQSEGRMPRWGEGAAVAEEPARAAAEASAAGDRASRDWNAPPSEAGPHGVKSTRNGDGTSPAVTPADARQHSRKGAQQGGEAAEWLRHVEEGPGALLRRTFEREQARRPAVAPESAPW